MRNVLSTSDCGSKSLRAIEVTHLGMEEDPCGSVLSGNLGTSSLSYLHLIVSTLDKVNDLLLLYIGDRGSENSGCCFQHHSWFPGELMFVA